VITTGIFWKLDVVSQIDVLTELLKWLLMVKQKRGSMFYQTLHERVASKQKIQPSDYSKWYCVLWHYVISLLLLNQISNNPRDELLVGQYIDSCFLLISYILWNHYVSPHKMGRHIVFSSVVCPSVRLLHFLVRSISFEPLVGFTNNFAQMSSMIRRCAVSMFDQGRVKVKVTI